MRALLMVIILGFISLPGLATPVSKSRAISFIKAKFPEAENQNTLIGYAIQRWSISQIGLTEQIAWNPSNDLHDTQVVLYSIFQDLLDQDPEWINFFNKSKVRFSKGSWSSADDCLRDSYATALAFFATGSLNSEYAQKMSIAGRLLALVDAWFRTYGPVVFSEGIFHNWNLSVVHTIKGSTNYKSEMGWMLESLLLVEGEVRIYTPDKLRADTATFLSGRADLNLTVVEAPVVAKILLRGFPKEKDFLDFLLANHKPIFDRLKKPGARKIYQEFFSFVKERLVGKRALIAAEKLKKEAAVSLQKWQEEQGLALTIAFSEALEKAAGSAEHYKFRRQKLVDAAMELFRKDRKTPWPDLLKNSQVNPLVLYVVQRIYAEPELRAMIESHYHLTSISEQIVPISVKVKKEGDPRVETKYPPEKCAGALRYL